MWLLLFSNHLRNARYYWITYINWAITCSGVFSTGATGAIAPAILRKRLIAPAILHLPGMYSQRTQILRAIDFITESFQLWYFFFRIFSEGKFLLHFAPMYIANFVSKNLCLLWDSRIVLNQKVVTSKHQSAFF